MGEPRAAMAGSSAAVARGSGEVSVLVDLRPAFAGNAGIPQETRLLFDALLQAQGLHVAGLLQGGGEVLRPPRALGASRPQDMASWRRVLEPTREPEPHRRGPRIWRQLRAGAAWTGAWAKAAIGRPQCLSPFEAPAGDGELWRALFARTLDPDRFVRVTSAPFRVLAVPWSAAHAGGLLTARLGHAFYPRVDTDGFQVMIAQTPYPGRVRPGTHLVVRYHDTVPLRMASTTRRPAYDCAVHREALLRNIDDGAWFACVSDATRCDLLSLFPALERRCVTIPNLLSPQFHEEASERSQVANVLRSRRAHGARHGASPVPGRDPDVGHPGVPDFLLMVSTFEPRKNHVTMLDAWERLRERAAPGLHLVLVGSRGWGDGELAARLERHADQRALHVLSDVPAAELRLLYRHARVTVCPSLGEGFGYSGVEAMACGGLVVASDIEAHREVYRDAADYFDPRSHEALVATLLPWLEPGRDEAREQRVRRGTAVAGRYRTSNVLPCWSAFLRALAGGSIRDGAAWPRCPAA